MSDVSKSPTSWVLSIGCRGGRRLRIPLRLAYSVVQECPPIRQRTGHLLLYSLALWQMGVTAAGGPGPK
jgi:hypothetical protein